MSNPSANATSASPSTSKMEPDSTVQDNAPKPRLMMLVMRKIMHNSTPTLSCMSPTIFEFFNDSVINITDLTRHSSDCPCVRCYVENRDVDLPGEEEHANMIVRSAPCLAHIIGNEPEPEPEGLHEERERPEGEREENFEEERPEISMEEHREAHEEEMPLIEYVERIDVIPEERHEVVYEEVPEILYQEYPTYKPSTSSVIVQNNDNVEEVPVSEQQSSEYRVRIPEGQYEENSSSDNSRTASPIISYIHNNDIGEGPSSIQHSSDCRCDRCEEEYRGAFARAANRIKEIQNLPPHTIQSLRRPDNYDVPHQLHEILMQNDPYYAGMLTSSHFNRYNEYASTSNSRPERQYEYYRTYERNHPYHPRTLHPASYYASLFLPLPPTNRDHEVNVLPTEEIDDSHRISVENYRIAAQNDRIAAENEMANDDDQREQPICETPVNLLSWRRDDQYGRTRSEEDNNRSLQQMERTRRILNFERKDIDQRR